jgi:hypothetical protein
MIVVLFLTRAYNSHGNDQEKEPFGFGRIFHGYKYQKKSTA